MDVIPWCSLVISPLWYLSKKHLGDVLLQDVLESVSTRVSFYGRFLQIQACFVTSTSIQSKQSSSYFNGPRWKKEYNVYKVIGDDLWRRCLFQMYECSLELNQTLLKNIHQFAIKYLIYLFLKKRKLDNKQKKVPPPQWTWDDYSLIPKPTSHRKHYTYRLYHN